MRRRGYTPEAILDFINRVGVAKNYSVIDIALLEASVRDDLNQRAQRRMAVLNPLKLTILNYPEDQVEMMEAVNNPEDPSAGTRQVSFSRTLWIEQDDFREEPPPKYFRLSPGREIRLRYAYFVTCVDFIKDSGGNVTEVLCTYDPATRGGDAPDGRKVKSTIHWVSAANAVSAEVRLYDRLFSRPDPEASSEDDGGFFACLNPDSLQVLQEVKVESSLVAARPGDRFQFERQGYFCLDPDSQKSGKLIFNRTVALKDTWARIEKSQQ
jgi:glutaminyl-tRNA synthetase